MAIKVQGTTVIDDSQGLRITGLSTFAGIATHTAALFGTTASFSGVVTASSFTGNASSATYAPVAGLSTYAVTAGIATYANVSGFSTVAGIATYAPTAGLSTYAVTAGIATYAPTAGLSTYAVTAGIATYTPTAGLSTYAVTAGIATYAPTAGIASALTSTASVNTTGIITAAQFSTGSGTLGFNTNTISGPSEIIIDPSPVGVGTTSGILRIRGDLYVDGTQFVVNSSTIELADLRVGIATTVGTNLLLDGGGIGIGSANIVKTITWNNTASALTSSEDWNLVSGKQYEINGTSVLSSTTLGSSVVNSSLTSVGTLGQLNVTGVVTAASFSGNASSATYAPTAGLSTYAVTAGIATYTPTAGVSTSVSGGTGSLTQLQVTGISTFSNGPVLIGSGTSTGTPNQRLQVTGGGYVSNSIGIGTTNPFPGSAYQGIDVNYNNPAIFSRFSGSGNEALLATVDQDYFTSFKGVLLGKKGSAVTGTTAGVSNADLGYLAFQNTTNAVIYTNGQTPLIFSTFSTERLRIDGLNGNVGIGISVPTSKLHVSGDANITGVVTAASFSGNASSATYAPTAGIATYAPTAGLSTYAVTSGIATYAPTAGLSTYSVRAGIATLAGNAGFATVAGIATYATVAGLSTYAVTAGIATYAPTAGLSTYAVTAGIATYAPTAGVSTSVSGGTGSLTQLNVSGISTLGTVQISTGIVTASSTSGIVTYYGDGSKLTGISASGGVSISTNTTNQNQFLTYAVSTGSTTGLGVTATGLVFNPSTTRLGIGSTNPSFTADVAGDIRVQSTNRMRFGGNSTTTNFYIQYNSTTNSLDFVAG